MRIRTSFRQLLLLAFVLISVALGAVSLSGLRALQGMMAQSREAADDAVRLNSAVQGLAERRTDMERAARQYLVLGDDALRRRFDTAANEAQGLIRPLSENRESAPLAIQWMAALTRIRTQIADPRLSVDARDQSIGSEFRTLDELSRTLTARVQDMLSSRSRALQDALEARRAQLARQVVFTIVLAALAAWGFGVWLTRPLRRLKRAIVELGQNRLDTPVAIGGPHDLRTIGQQLEWLRLRLTELDADKARFLRHLSHELKTPLAAMREGVALLREGVGGPLSPDQREIADILGQNTTVLQQQIEDLLTFNAAAFDARRLQRQPTDLRALVEQVVDAQRLQWQARQIQVQVSGSALNLPVDPVKLGMALSNLLSNAIRFSPSSSTIRWTLGRVGHEAQLCVQDEGPGIADPDRQRIFEPFFRGRLQPEGQPRGSGVGLSIVQEIVIGHGGRIELRPYEPGQGACFCIHLPLGPRGLNPRP